MALASRRYHSWDDASSPRNQRGMPDYSDPQEQQVLPTRPSKYLVVPIHVFKNGDPFYTGKKFVANTKSAPTFNHLLEQLTDLIKPITGPVGRLYTPMHGSRVRSFEDLRNGGAYVAAGRKEQFKNANYFNIRSLAPIVAGGRVARAVTPRLARGDFANNPHIPPPRRTDQEEHNVNVKGPPKVIHVFRNGDEFYKPMTIFLKPLEQTSLPRVWASVAEKVQLKNTRPIRRLYRMNGERVRSVEEIENGAYFVAASREKFVRANYGRDLPALHLGGRYVNRQAPKFLNGPPSAGQRGRTHIASFGPNSTATPPPPPQDPKRSKYVNEQGIYAKPVRFTKNRSDKKTLTDSGREGEPPPPPMSRARTISEPPNQNGPQLLSERQHTYVVPENRQRALSEMPARDPPTSRQGAVQPDGGGMMYSPRRDDPAYSGAPQPQVVNERQLRQPWSSSADVATDARQPSEEREQQRASPGRVAAAPYSGFVPITPPEGKQRRQKPPQIPRRLQANNARPIGRQQAPLPPVAGSRRAPPPESAPEPWSDVGPDEPASDNPYYDGAQFTGEPYGPGGFIDHPRREEPPESEDPLPVGDAEGGAPDAPPAADAPAANQEGAGAEAEEEAEAQPNANEQPSNTLGTITEESARR